MTFTEEIYWGRFSEYVLLHLDIKRHHFRIKAQVPVRQIFKSLLLIGHF